jgi:hypothetical protein
MLTTWHSLSAKVGTNFVDKGRSVRIVRSRTLFKDVSIARIIVHSVKCKIFYLFTI